MQTVVDRVVEHRADDLHVVRRTAQGPAASRQAIDVRESNALELVRERSHAVAVAPPRRPSGPRVLGQPQLGELATGETSDASPPTRIPLRLPRLGKRLERANPPLPSERRVIDADAVPLPPLLDHATPLSRSHASHSLTLNLPMPAEQLRRHPFPDAQLDPSRREPEVRRYLPLRQPRLRARTQRHPDEPARHAVTTTDDGSFVASTLPRRCGTICRASSFGVSNSGHSSRNSA